MTDDCNHKWMPSVTDTQYETDIVKEVYCVFCTETRELQRA